MQRDGKSDRAGGGRLIHMHVTPGRAPSSPSAYRIGASARAGHRRRKTAGVRFIGEVGYEIKPMTDRVEVQMIGMARCGDEMVEAASIGAAPEVFDFLVLRFHDGGREEVLERVNSIPFSLAFHVRENLERRYGVELDE